MDACATCGTDLAVDARFCFSCGVRWPRDLEPASAVHAMET
jgi:hypothetical protein